MEVNQSILRLSFFKDECVCVCVINSLSFGRKRIYEKKKSKNKKSEKCYHFVLAFFDENVETSLTEVVGAITGFEMAAGLERELTLDSLELGFLDGMLRVFLEATVP